MTYNPSRDLRIEVPAGNIVGMESMNKFGANVLSAADTQEDCWIGTQPYVYPATALMTHASQTVDQIAMRGGSINYHGLDENWDQFRGKVVLDASDTTTPVALPTALIRVFRMSVDEPVVIDSAVRIHNAAETQDYAIIGAGDNQTLMALYTVPAGYTAYMSSYYCTVTDATNKTPTSTEVILWGRDNFFDHEFQIKHAVAIAEGQGVHNHKFNPYYSFRELTDIRVTTYCADEPAHIHAGFDLYLRAD